MRSKLTVLVGVALIILGAVALIYRGITYTTQELIVRIGTLEATAEVEKTIPLPPVVGAVVLVGGIALLIVGIKGS